MEFDKVIYSRRSYRSYLDKKISNEDLNEILKAGMNAPVSMGRYDNIKIVVLEDEKLKEFRDKLLKTLNKDVSFNSNKLILIYSKGEHLILNGLDVGCIGENMMLKAKDLNIDSVMICSFIPLFENIELFKEYNIIEGNYKFVASIALGYRANDEVRNVTHKIEVIR